MVLLLQYTLIFASVLILVALGGCFSEHSGVINLGLEGVMIMGALGGALAMRYMPANTSAFVMIVVVSLPVGLFAASHQGGRLDRALTMFGQVVMAVPPFFTGILLTLLCGLVLHWFNPGTFVAPSQGFWRSVGYLLYPAIAIALPRIAMTVKMLKSSIAGELEKDYVRTAYSRGNSPRCLLYTSLYRHVLRNAVVPTVAFLAMTVADIVAGSVIIEQVFAISGLGRLLLSSISNRDFPVVQAIVVILALWVVLVNCLADIINQQLDPRLRLQ